MSSAKKTDAVSEARKFLMGIQLANRFFKAFRSRSTRGLCRHSGSANQSRLNTCFAHADFSLLPTISNNASKGITLMPYKFLVASWGGPGHLGPTLSGAPVA